MGSQSKRLKAAYENVDRKAVYELVEAVKKIKAAAGVKFDETVEIAMNLGVDPRHAAKDAKAEEARKAGADLVGAEDLAEKIQAGEMNFDRCIATPDMMPVVGRLGKVLGPRGLMPNPKLGTVTTDVAGAIKAVKGGQVEFRVEKAGIVHAGVGKTSFGEDALVENIRAFVDAISRAKPSGAKGTYIKRISLSSTMGPGVRVEVGSIHG